MASHGIPAPQSLTLATASSCSQSPHDWNHWFRLIANVSPVLTWVTNAQGDVIFGNHACEDFFGRKSEDISASGTWEAYIHPDDYATYVEKYLEAQESVKEFRCDVRLKRCDGQWRWMATYAAPYTEEGRFCGFVGTSPDVTDRVLLERQRVEKEKMTSKFVAMLAHELRNPLTPIANSVEILKRWQPPLEQVPRSMVDVIDRQLDHLTRLVGDLCDIHRIERGKITLKRQALDLRLVLTSAIEASQPNLERRNQVALTKMPGHAVVLAAGDELRLWQVFSNLINNASKFTPEGKEITISLEEKCPNAVVTVSDQGVGMDSQDLGRIFEVFTQLQRHPDSSGGLGLGLAIAKGFVQMHGGTIEAKSAGPGMGSQIVVTLPMMPSFGNRTAS